MSCNTECPICISDFKEPVVASDGNTYDLECLRLWYKGHKVSPMTRKEISNYVFRNMAVCQMLQINAPSNDTFDLACPDLKWDSPPVRLIPESLRDATEEIQSPSSNIDIDFRCDLNVSKYEMAFWGVLILYYLFSVLKNITGFTSAAIVLILGVVILGSIFFACY